MKAELLKKGDTIGLCSPSHIANREDYAKIIAIIESWGYRVKEAPNLYSSSFTYGASPEERASDFNCLIADDEVKMVFFGGGEGSCELIPLMDFEAIKRHPKIIASYSDGTTILDTIYARTGLEVYYGQAPGGFRDTPISEYDRAQFMQHFVDGSDPVFHPASRWRVMTPGRGEGILIGGYSRNFALLLGNKYFSYDKHEKHILFIEDHEVFGGVDYVSAMLSNIEQSDFINTVSGFIFGHYSEKPHPELLERIGRFGEAHSIPSVYCDDFGHGRNHAVLPIGRRAVLDADAPSLVF